MEEDRHSPIPVPKGSYNLNFDEIDEDSNPFQTKTVLGQSPPVGGNINPFQTISKMGHSPQTNSNNNIYDIDIDIGEDPFKSKNQLSSSPPQTEQVLPTNSSPMLHESSPVESGQETVKQGNKIPRSPEEPQQTATFTEQQGLSTADEADSNPTDSKPTDIKEESDTAGSAPKEDKVKMKPPSKKPGGKKGIKKPKIRSKFKPPENFGIQGGDDDIQIFAPKKESNPSPPREEDPPRTEEPVKEEVPLNEEADPKQQTTNEEAGTGSGEIDSSNQMTRSLEMMHDFGAAEMPDSDENEGFVPANEVFSDTADWEMLEKLSGKGQGDLVRDSLYTKFDPLVQENSTANQVPDSSRIRNDNTETQADQSVDLLSMTTPPPPSKTSRVPKHPAARVLQEQVEENGNAQQDASARSVDKMLFSPTNSVKSPPDEIDGTRYYDAYDFPPTARGRNSRGSKSDGEGDRSGYKMENTESVVQLVQENSLQVLKYSQSEWNKLKQDLDLEFQAKLLNKEREWSRKLADREKNLSRLEDQCKSLKQANHDMRCVVTEFEKTIAQLQAEKEKSCTESQQSMEDIVKERDQALEDLQSVEMAFSDLHRRYEKTKGVVEGFKKNEEVLKKCVQDYQSKLKKSEDKLQDVLQQAEHKLDRANQEIEKVRKTTIADVARLEAAMRKSDLRVQGLEKTLEQKIQENQELTEICDELIAKVGTD
ncbi:transforming acidic coiled-coil-containing protein 1-like isoform X2 [Mizuhopecten yessoensis]|uniref:transforming acidic coiled-coil-containing protein 1-like isoform X2 n=1 Tax=Mizuhopecten yessoensis TaxID=6573 RepID=UPI000B45D240|nr:transforming acidic coiled-coil-containing protein 1-like isoform X2 [Mizuhopecten yessoensis]